MAEKIQTISVVADGRQAEVDYPADWTAKQIDDHLQANGAHRFTNITDPASPWPTGYRLMGEVRKDLDPLRNLTTAQKALFLASFATGGPEVMTGLKLGGAVAKGAGFGTRTASGGLQLAKGTVAGGGGAYLGQQLGEENAPSVQGGAAEGFLTMLGGLGIQSLVNNVSKMLMGHITQSFLDTTSLKNFLTYFMPKVFSQKDNAATMFNSVLEGKIAVTAEQEITAARQLAARGAQQPNVVLPNVTKQLKRLGFDLKGDYANVDWATGLMPVEAAMAAYRDLTPFVSKEGAALAGTSAALMRNIRDYADDKITTALGGKAADIWTAGKTRYGQLQRINDFLTGGDPKVFRANGTPDFEYLKEKFLKDFTGDRGVRDLMGNVYDNLRDTVFRQGSVLVRDVPGYMPFTRGWMTQHGPGATIGIPYPARLAGTPGEIPMTAAAPIAAGLGPLLTGGNIPSGVSP